jgi:hypothetical protein
MLQMGTTLIDEVPYDPINFSISPTQPVFNSRFYIEHCPTVKLSGVHLTNLILSAMLTTVDGSEDKCFRMQGVTVKFPRVSQLEDPLTDFHGSTVNLVQEKKDRIVTSFFEPVWWIERSAITISAGQPNEVTLGHLGGSSFHDGKSKRFSGLIDHTRFAHTVTTAKQHRFLDSRY